MSYCNTDWTQYSFKYKPNSKNFDDDLYIIFGMHQKRRLIDGHEYYVCSEG